MLHSSFQVDFDRPKAPLRVISPAEIDDLLLLLNGDEVGVQARSAFLEIARGLVGSIEGRDHLLLDGFLEMSHEQRVEMLLNFKA